MIKMRNDFQFIKTFFVAALHGTREQKWQKGLWTKIRMSLGEGMVKVSVKCLEN